jgi:hypothetical protein
VQLFSTGALSSKLFGYCRADFIQLAAFSSIEYSAVERWLLIGDSAASHTRDIPGGISRARHFKLPGTDSRAHAWKSRDCCTAAWMAAIR